MTMSITETFLKAGVAGQVIHVVGVGTAWDGSTAFTLSAGSITNKVVVNTTHITLTVTATATVQTITLTDTTDSITATIPVQASFTITEAAIERGTTGNVIHLVGVGTAWTSGSTFTVSSGSITNMVATDGTHVALTLTAAATAGTVTVTDTGTTTHPTATVTNSDTTVPHTPAGFAIGAAIPATWDFTLSWTAVAPSPAGETISYTITQNGTPISTAQSGTTLAVVGAEDGDVFTVIAKDNANNVSVAASATFSSPTGDEVPGFEVYALNYDALVQAGVTIPTWLKRP